MFQTMVIPNSTAFNCAMQTVRNIFPKGNLTGGEKKKKKHTPQ